MGYVYAVVYRAQEAVKKEVVNSMVYWNIMDRRIVGGKKTSGMGYVYAVVYRAQEAVKKEVVNSMVYWNIMDRRHQ
nr:hAT transposon superfamily [Tanacetum cinerariifolium]